MSIFTQISKMKQEWFILNEEKVLLWNWNFVFFSVYSLETLKSVYVDRHALFSCWTRLFEVNSVWSDRIFALGVKNNLGSSCRKRVVLTFVEAIDSMRFDPRLSHPTCQGVKNQSLTLFHYNRSGSPITPELTLPGYIDFRF